MGAAVGPCVGPVHAKKKYRHNSAKEKYTTVDPGRSHKIEAMGK